MNKLLEAFRIFAPAELLKVRATAAAEAEAALRAEKGAEEVSPAEVKAARTEAMDAALATYGDDEIALLSEHYGKKGAIIDGDSRLFDSDAAIDQWRQFRTSELCTKSHMSWRQMCKELLLDQVQETENVTWLCV